MQLWVLVDSFGAVTGIAPNRVDCPPGWKCLPVDRDRVPPEFGNGSFQDWKWVGGTEGPALVRDPSVHPANRIELRGYRPTPRIFVHGTDDPEPPVPSTGLLVALYRGELLAVRWMGTSDALPGIPVEVRLSDGTVLLKAAELPSSAKFDGGLPDTVRLWSDVDAAWIGEIRGKGPETRTVEVDGTDGSWLVATARAAVVAAVGGRLSATASELVATGLPRPASRKAEATVGLSSVPIDWLPVLLPEHRVHAIWSHKRGLRVCPAQGDWKRMTLGNHETGAERSWTLRVPGHLSGFSAWFRPPGLDFVPTEVELHGPDGTASGIVIVREENGQWPTSPATG